MDFDMIRGNIGYGKFVNSWTSKFEIDYLGAGCLKPVVDNPQFYYYLLSFFQIQFDHWLLAKKWNSKKLWDSKVDDGSVHAADIPQNWRNFFKNGSLCEKLDLTC